MSEIIIIHDGETGKAVGTMSKKDAHNKQVSSYKLKKEQIKHKHIDILLFNLKGHLLTSKRDFENISNPDMIDKTAGGHILAGHDNNSAVAEIAGRELSIPITIVSKQELIDIITNYPELLKKQAFITEVGYVDDFFSTRIMKDGFTWKERRMQYHYVGVYDGPYTCEEGVGIQPFSLERIEKYIGNNPKQVTADFKFILDSYEEYLTKLTSTIEDSKKIKRKNIPEIIECYNLNGKFVGTETRKEVHHPMIKSYTAKKSQKVKHKHIGGLLVGKEGEVYLQIRSKNKAENPEMFDKIVGGHVPAGDSEIIASYHEFFEEMNIPSAFFNPVVWKNFLINVPEVTEYQAICKKPVFIRNYKSWRMRKDGKSFMETCDQYLIIGRYSGNLKFVDREAAGIFQFESREALAAEMKKHPKKFTEDIKYIVKFFWDELVALEKFTSY